MPNILRAETFEFTIKGKGETAADALQKAFGLLRKQAYAKVPGPIVYMEPTAVHVINRQEVTSREAFLLVFFPRQRVSIDLEVLVEVMVKYVDI